MSQHFWGNEIKGTALSTRIDNIKLKRENDFSHSTAAAATGIKRGILKAAAMNECGRAGLKGIGGQWGMVMVGAIERRRK